MVELNVRSLGMGRSSNTILVFTFRILISCQDDILRDHPSARGAMLVPIIAGSDKTTVSVATGHQEFHPVYAGAGNLDNTTRRSHSQGMEPIALLPIPKSESVLSVVLYLY